MSLWSRRHFLATSRNERITGDSFVETMRRCRLAGYSNRVTGGYQEQSGHRPVSQSKGGRGLANWLAFSAYSLNSWISCECTQTDRCFDGAEGTWKSPQLDAPAERVWVPSSIYFPCSRSEIIEADEYLRLGNYANLCWGLGCLISHRRHHPPKVVDKDCDIRTDHQRFCSRHLLSAHGSQT